MLDGHLFPDFCKTLRYLVGVCSEHVAMLHPAYAN